MRHLWIGTFIASLAGLGSASAATAAPQSPEAQLKICVNACSSTRGADDRATCKLQCRNEFEEAKLVAQTPPPKPVPKPAPPKTGTTLAATPAVAPAVSPKPAKVRWTAADLTRCQSVCDHEALSTDRATCRLQCKAKASEYSTATAKPPPPARANVSTTPHTGTYTPSGRLSANGPMVFSPTLPSTAPAARRALLEAEANKCKATCNRSAYRNNTDRETCKLTCNSKLNALPQGTIYHNGGASAAATRRAVIESSGGVAGPSPAPSYPAAATHSNYPSPPATGTSRPLPPAKSKTTLVASPTPAKSCAAVTSCNRGCDNQKSLCVSSCEQENKRATDRATCKLTCTNNVEVCAEICASKVSMCQPKAVAK